MSDRPNMSRRASAPRLRSYTKRNEAVEAIRDGDSAEGLALILCAWYDLALEVCSGLEIPLSSAPPPRRSEARLDDGLP